MIVYHHNDNDGRCAAAIAFRWYTAQARVPPKDKAIRFREMDYKDIPDLSEIGKDEMVVILDFSFKPDIFAKLNRDHVIWCDHHKTCEAYPYAKEPIRGIRDFTEKGRSGCELAWGFFFPREPMPEAVKLIGDYDSWRLDTAPKCFQFYEGMKLRDTLPESQEWKTLFRTQDCVQAVCGEGVTAIRYRDNHCSNLRRSYGYEATLRYALEEGRQVFFLDCYALNAYMFGSKMFGDLVNQYPVLAAYIHDGKRFTVSLYSVKLDVSVIAKALGGGGSFRGRGVHVRAASVGEERDMTMYDHYSQIEDHYSLGMDRHCEDDLSKTLEAVRKEFSARFGPSDLRFAVKEEQTKGTTMTTAYAIFSAWERTLKPKAPKITEDIEERQSECEEVEEKADTIVTYPSWWEHLKARLGLRHMSQRHLTYLRRRVIHQTIHRTTTIFHETRLCPHMAADGHTHLRFLAGVPDICPRCGSKMEEER